MLMDNSILHGRNVRHAMEEVAWACFVSSDLRSAVKYVSPQLRAKATKRFKTSAASKGMEIVVTVGKPNWSERKFVKQCELAGEKFPVQRLQMSWWPKHVRAR